VKTIYCRLVTPLALKLIRSYDGDAIGEKAILCHFFREEPSRDNKGHIVPGAFQVIFPNGKPAIRSRGKFPLCLLLRACEK
jgi:hypothetical protein